ncbi:uncharacterized protein family [Actinidia rufa]|uniref:GDT1 family protein n=1 Tax=Actinidia rufa TaxID=165716 RepID=A0A7J0GIU5_9ERIC|nr:uncharacterized protein family [Actinidia rufa]
MTVKTWEGSAISEATGVTFFIAALLAMQYEKGLVLLGSMGALSLMTLLSVIIGRIFQSVPAQFQTTLPIGEYAAVTLLMFFGLKSIKDAWNLPLNEVKSSGTNNPELGEYVEAEELVKEKEWGDRSMLATIALGATQVSAGTELRLSLMFDIVTVHVLNFSTFLEMI